MMTFIRKYQRYFYFVITAVTIASFSFFGTYGTIGVSGLHEQEAFKAVDGSPISRSELDEMALFIATDEEDKRLYGVAWGPNFLNDGVIKQDFLATGLAEILMNAYIEDLKEDLNVRFRKEKNYTPYVHPYANFLSAETSWKYFAPYILSYYQQLKDAESPIDPETIKAKIGLYLGQQQFSPLMLQRVLTYQEKQYGWIPHDPSIERGDLFLFNYHTLDDWFGSRFTRLMAQFIINSAKIAEQHGYVVTSEEALADLLVNAQKSFKESSQHPHLGVTTPSEYFREQLRRLGMDQTKAVKIWRDVLLFRRLFQDFGNSVFVDPNGYLAFDAFATEKIDGDLFRLTDEFHFGTFNDLQEFETYLSAISKRDENNLLVLPTTIYNAADVAKKTPELVEKKYVVEVASVDKKQLESKVGIKETWNWEVEELNWYKLKSQFPELATQKNDTKEERFQILDGLDSITRTKIDQIARSAIVDSRPEWLVNALEAAPFSKMDLGVRLKGGKLPLKGIQNREDFIQKLDAAEVGGASFDYKGDNRFLYRMRVIEKNPELELLKYADVSADSTLEDLVNQNLEFYYVKIRGNDPEKYQYPNKTWKTLTEVRPQIAEEYFAGILNAIRSSAKVNKEATPDTLASLRFYKFAQAAEEALKKDPQSVSWIMPENPGVQDQWKFVKSEKQINRGTHEEDVKVADIFNLKEGEWMSVQTPPDGDLYFFHQKQRIQEIDPEVVADQVAKARQILNEDAQQMLMRKLLVEIQAKDAISFKYLSQKEPQLEVEPPINVDPNF